MKRFHIVTANEDPYVATPEDLERLSRAVELVRSLINDPSALLDRARGLLDGTAQRIEGII